jgi:hypothetical protein
MRACSTGLGGPRLAAAASLSKSPAYVLGHWCHEQAQERKVAPIRAADSHDLGVASLEAIVLRRAQPVRRSPKLLAI